MFENHKQHSDACPQIDGHCEHDGVWHDQLDAQTPYDQTPDAESSSNHEKYHD